MAISRHKKISAIERQPFSALSPDVRTRPLFSSTNLHSHLRSPPSIPKFDAITSSRVGCLDVVAWGQHCSVPLHRDIGWSGGPKAQKIELYRAASDRHNHQNHDDCPSPPVSRTTLSIDAPPLPPLPFKLTSPLQLTLGRHALAAHGLTVHGRDVNQPAVSSRHEPCHIAHP